MKDKDEESYEEKPRFQTNTSISGFLKNLSTDNDFAKTNLSQASSIYELKGNLIDFCNLISAPEYEITDEPISIFRNLKEDGDLLDEEEEDCSKELEFKNNLRNVIKKFIKPEEIIEENVDEEEEKEETKTVKIPNIGKMRLTDRVIQGIVPHDQARNDQLVKFCIFEKIG
jgi:hypothetical protein